VIALEPGFDCFGRAVGRIQSYLNFVVVRAQAEARATGAAWFNLAGRRQHVVGF